MIFADLHNHSHYSIGVSKKMNLDNIAYLSRIKGITLVGTGDFTHPLWLGELKKNLKETKKGVFSYRGIDFILQGEVNLIFKRNEKVKKIHMLVFSPSFEDVYKINTFLEKFGKLKASGRPTIKLDIVNFIEGILSISPDSFFIPAHIWTPWHSLFGVYSGFTSADEAFLKYKNEIFAYETGLSSDFSMNKDIFENINFVSFSDAHSPLSIGREATIFKKEQDFFSLKKNLKDLTNTDLTGTVEMFPQMGKYYFNGHKKCNSFSKEEKICPVCGKPYTIGVLFMTEQLRNLVKKKIDHIQTTKKEKEEYHVVPLLDILKKIFKKKELVDKYYEKLTKEFNNELSVLIEAPVLEIEKFSNFEVANTVSMIRSKNILFEEGFDGKYGSFLLPGRNA